jgi:hypothetical protein
MSIEYKIIRKQKLKRVYLKVNNDLSVEVSANNSVSIKVIDDFVNSKITWIKSSIKKIESKNRTKVGLESQLLYLGGHYPVHFKPGYSDSSYSIHIEKNKVIVVAQDECMSESFYKLLDKFYKVEAKRIILPIVGCWAAKMQVVPNKISFRKNKSRWGSCSWQNNLSLNFLLMKLPVKTIEYIVVHELAHITHKNHSKSFWSLVEIFLPDYLERRKILREFEKYIF